MIASVNSKLRRFTRDEKGGVLIFFSLAALVIIGVVGLAIDGARAYHANTRVGAALDAAALAAAKARNEQGLEGDALRDYAERFFQSNVAGTGLDPVSYRNLSVRPGANGRMTVSVDTVVENYFGGLFQIPTFEFTRAATAVYNIRDIELALALDITGSMCNPCSKINALKAASRDLVDILISNANNPAQKVRLALAPYSAAVNAGAIADEVLDPAAPRDGDCAIERSGAHAYTDTMPGDGAWIASADPAAPPADIDPTENTGSYFCPNAEIMPLTDSASSLKARINSLSTGGWTAGHIGLAWAWYMISEEWASIWHSGSQPAPYGDNDTIKAVLMMTDGIFNTAYANGESADQALDLCTEMRDRGVIVFSVAFQAPTAAADTLRDCASPAGGEFGQTFFDAQNGTELRQAFISIANQLNTLRLAE
ncbi:MAG: hypothetical protein GC150_13750 [Rhizobiales bacterium]|nr:hypothetical protein [Hyphomicrobiales bacterium]